MHDFDVTGENQLCQKQARARLQWAGAWVKLCTLNAGDAAEEPTMWLRNVAPPVVTGHHPKLDVTLGRTRN